MKATSISNGHVEGFLDVPGGRLYREADGAGTALILLHAGVAHLRMWDEQVPEFARRHRVIRYDQRGFGRTTSEDVEFSNRGDLARALDDAGVDRAHVLGLSRGATIALDFTIERPERVTSLVFCSSVPGGFDFEAPEMDTLENEMERVEAARDWEALVELETRLWTDGPGQPADRVDPDLRRRMVEWGLENYRADAGRGRPRPLDPAAVSRLGEVRVPTLLMWGDLDEVGTRAGSEAVAAGIAGARSHVFAGAAHMINLEQPEAYARLVLDFLSEVDGIPA